LLALICAPILSEALASRSAPQTPEPQTDELVAREVAFARGLAREWGYFDLAQQVLLGIAERAPNRTLRRERAELLELEAARSATAAGAIALLFEAVTERARMLNEVDARAGPTAQDELDYLRACSLLGRASGDASAVRAAGLPRKQILDSIGAGIVVADRTVLVTATALSGGEAKRVHLQASLFRARLERSLASLANDPAHLERAEAMFTELITTVGEPTRAGLELLLEMSDLAEERGDLDHAIDLSLFVSAAVWPRGEPVHDPGAEPQGELSSEDLRWSLYEAAVRRALPALRRSGRQKEARARAFAFYDSWKSAGTNLGDPEGVGALLECARIVAEAGGVVARDWRRSRWYESEEAIAHAGRSRRRTLSAAAFAMGLATEARDYAKGSSKQEAIGVIAELHHAFQAPLQPEERLVIARRTLELGDAPRALSELRDLMRDLDAQDMATQVMLWPRTLFCVGECYRRMSRPLESAMAHREALERWSGDYEFDWQNAEAYLHAMEILLAGAPGDPLFRELREQASNAVLSYSDGVSAEVITFRHAHDLLKKGNFRHARERFLSVRSSGLTEKAIAYAAQCLYELGLVDDAERELREYIERYVEDPRNAPLRTEAIADRREALALAEYTLGRALRHRAEQTNDPADHLAVVDLLCAYPDRHPEQTGFAPSALYATVLSQIALGELDAAEATCDQLCTKYAHSELASSAPLKLYAAIRSSSAPAGLTGKRLTTLAGLLRTSNELAPFPSPRNLRVEAELHFELGRWVAAERALTRLRAHLKANGDPHGELVSFVLPRLGHCLLEQGWIDEAFAVLDPLVPSSSAEAFPDESLLLDWYKAVFGWIDRGPNGPFRVSGRFLTLSAERLSDACTWMQRLAVRVERDVGKWNCEWYRRKLLLAYGYRQWSQVDPRQEPVLHAQIDALRDLGGSDVPKLLRACDSRALSDLHRALVEGDLLEEGWGE